MTRPVPVDDRVLYLKGGRAIDEARALFPRIGELPDGGPDKFLLAVLHHARHAVFRLASLGPRTARARLAGREVTEYGVRPEGVSGFRRRLAFLAAATRFLVDTIAFRPRHVLCGIDGPFAIAAWLAARVVGARYVYLAHCALALPSLSAAHRAASRFVCRRADQVITHGPFVTDEAIRLRGTASGVVEFNNALDPEHLTLLAGLPGKPAGTDGGGTILYVGRLEEDKGALDLLAAFALLPCRRSARLHFVGEGGARSALEERISGLGLAGQVQVIGSVPHAEVFARMHAAAVVVTPSRSCFPEGFCKSAMEAFYVGTPVIAPDYGPFPFLIAHERNGLLYRADSVVALAAAIGRLLADTDLRRQLQAGAVASGQALMTPRTTFARAVGAVLAAQS